VTQTELIRKPLGERSSADVRKFPAATFTSILILPKCLNVYSTTLYASSCFHNAHTSVQS